MVADKKTPTKVNAPCGSVVELLNRLNSEDIGFSKIRVTENYGPVINRGSKMYYFITDGCPLFVVDDRKFQLRPQDLLEIPLGSKYLSRGVYEGYTISVPAFDSSKVDFL